MRRFFAARARRLRPGCCGPRSPPHSAHGRSPRTQTPPASTETRNPAHRTRCMPVMFTPNRPRSARQPCSQAPASGHPGQCRSFSGSDPPSAARSGPAPQPFPRARCHALRVRLLDDHRLRLRRRALRSMVLPVLPRIAIGDHRLPLTAAQRTRQLHKLQTPGSRLLFKL